MDEVALAECRNNRMKEYPPIGEQLDAIFKGGIHFENMKAQIQAVKNKYPKGV